jgi:hypothetical protein
MQGKNMNKTALQHAIEWRLEKKAELRGKDYGAAALSGLGFPFSTVAGLTMPIEGRGRMMSGLIDTGAAAGGAILGSLPGYALGNPDLFVGGAVGGGVSGDLLVRHLLQKKLSKKAELTNVLTDKLVGVWQGLSDDQKMAIIGGGAGAVGGGAYGALTGGPERKDKIKKALLFGGAGAAAGAGAGYFGNQAVNAINPGTSSGAVTKTGPEGYSDLYAATMDRALKGK